MNKADSNNPEGRMLYGWKLLRDKKEEGADIVIEAIQNQFRIQDPQYYVRLSDSYYFAGNSEGLIENLQKALALDPASNFVRFNLATAYMEEGRYEEGLEVLHGGDQKDAFIIDATALLNYLNKNYEAAASAYEKYKEVESRYDDSTQSVPFRHRLAMTYLKLGRKAEADQLIIEHEKILHDMITGKRSKGTWTGLGGIYYDYALCQSYRGKKKEAIANLDSAFKYGWRIPWWYHNDPLLEPLKNDPGYKRVVRKVDDFFAFRQKAFSAALNRAEASKSLKINRER
jgi:tetratricopeptide (TPR) repeat protein